MPDRRDPVHPADDAAREQARAMLRAARHAALAFVDPATGAPGISRIAFGLCPAGGPMTLISALAAHHGALRAAPRAAVMLGEVGEKGDPLTHPRLMIGAEAEFVTRDTPDHMAIRARWLADHPKAALYVDFADFTFVRLHPVSGMLNAGFARAYRLEPADLAGMSSD